MKRPIKQTLVHSLENKVILSKVIFFIMLLLSTSDFASGQEVNICQKLNNDSIKFNIWRVQPDWEKGIYYSETIIGIESLDSICRKAIKRLTKNDWLKLLNDEKCDWAANLALYELHRKYAGVFRVIQEKNG